MRWRVAALLAFVGFVPVPTGAAPIFTGSPGTCPVDVTKCVEDNGDVRVELFHPFYIDPRNDTTGAYTHLFVRAFDAWASTQAERWFLIARSLSDTAELTLEAYHAFAGENPGCSADECGGADISLTYKPGAVADPTGIGDGVPLEFRNGIWAQSIWTSEKRESSAPGNPYLDGGQPDRHTNLPAYAFQYVGSRFEDKPSRNADNIWLGQAFLTQVDYNSRLIFAYGGVGWGFTVQRLPDGVVPPLPVPEPTTSLLCGAGLFAVALVQRRRVRGRTCTAR